MWKSTVDGRRLHFRLTGINNQNFIMSDGETGTWWQQVSGKALIGPLAGRRLEPIGWDEVTFAVFKKEYPDARVLLPSTEYQEEYASADWEERIAEYPTPHEDDPGDALRPRDLIVGIASGGESRAYRWSDLEAQHLIADTVGGTPVLLVLHPDGRSLRCFERRFAEDQGPASDLGAADEAIELTLRPDCPPDIIDTATQSEWDFTGIAAAGPLAGRRMRRIPCLKDYWFDWKAYNPTTGVFEIER